MSEYPNEDAVIACADLAARAGALGFEIGHDAEDDTPPDQVRWYAQVNYRGARLIADGERTPTAAAMALSERLLRGATCRCTRRVVLSGDPDKYRCRWRLMGARWEPACDVTPIRIEGQRGDHAAMRAALMRRKGQR